MDMTFGEIVRLLRETAELTQGELGKKLNMTQRKVSYIQNGKYEPSLQDICTFCRFFDVSADYLLGITNVKKTYPRV